jgi:hypothetical protein
LRRCSAGRRGDGLHFDPGGVRRGDARRHSGIDQLADRAVGRGDLDPALLDRHLGAVAVGGDRKGRAFDERDEIGRAHSEMRGRLLLDAESGSAPILQDLDETARLGGGRKAKLSRGRHDHIFLAAYEHRPAVGAGGYDVARSQSGPAHGRRGSAAMPHLHRSGRFRHPPKRSLSEGGMAPEEQQDDEGAHEHG